MKLKFAIRFCSGLILLAAVVGMVSLTPQARAAVIASETFNYVDGTTVGGETGGTGFVGAWNPVAPATADSWVVNGGIAQTSVTADPYGNMTRQLATPYTFLTANYYLRYDYTMPTPVGPNDPPIYGGLVIGPTGIAFGPNDLSFYSQEGVSEAYHLRVDPPAAGSTGGAPLTHNTDYTIVSRFEPNFTPGQTRLTVWVNDATEAPYEKSFESEPFYLQRIINNLSPSPNLYIGLYRESQDDTTVDYDNIFLGTTLDDVVAIIPEPSTVGLLFVGGIGLWLRRRKR